MGIVAFILILSILVLIHEAGHFFAARWSGVGVQEFGLGFPPRLISRTRGETVYSLNAIPFGGFVRLVGEDDAESQRPDSFPHAKYGRQAFILTAGVIMNFLLAWVIMSVLLGVGIRVDPSTIKQNHWTQLTDEQRNVAVAPGGAASEAGLRSDDLLVDVDDRSFTDTDALITYVTDRNYPDLVVTIVRDGQEVDVVVPAKETDNGKRYGIGIMTTATLTYPWSTVPWFGLTNVVDMSWLTIKGFGSLVAGLFRGEVSNDVTGPIGIAVLTNEVSKIGLVALMQFTAVLSISLAILNILPLPALDGGRLMLRTVSVITRRPVNRRMEAIIHTIGFYALIVFLMYISIRDVSRFDLTGRVLDLFR